MWDVNLNTFMLLLIALANLWAVHLARQTRTDMKTLETQTNSIKDALVAKTAEAAEAKGRDDQRAVSERTARELLSAGPLPVEDDRAATAAEKSAGALEKIADVAITNLTKAKP